MRSQLIPGTAVHPPDMARGTFLGRGGNGRIVKHMVYGREFAVKLVSLVSLVLLDTAIVYPLGRLV